MITTKEAVKKLVSELKTDPALRIGWQANIAVCFYDAFCAEYPDNNYDLRKVSSAAAYNFLKNLCHDSNNNP